MSQGVIIDPSTSNANVLEVAARLDGLKINRLHILATALCAAAMVVDGFELTLSSVFGAVFTPKEGVSAVQLAWLLGSMGVGAIIGAPMFGLIGDRFGRRAALIGALFFFGFFSISGGLSPDITVLTGMRFMAAMAIGAFQPLMAAYLVDVLPARRRGQFVLYTSVVAGLGASLPMFITRFFMGLPGFPIDGWRASLHLGGVAAISAGILLMILLPESARWLAGVGRHEEADAVCRRFERLSPPLERPALPARSAQDKAPVPAPTGREKLWSPGIRGRTVFILAIQALIATALYFITLQGAMFAHRGYDARESLMLSGLAVMIIPLGSLINSFLVDRVERRVAIGVLTTYLGIVAIAFLFARQPLHAVLAAAAYNMFTGSTALMIMIYTAELFPPHLRSLAATLGAASGRVAGTVLPFILLPLLYQYGDGPVIITMSGALGLIAVLMVFFGPASPHLKRVVALADPIEPPVVSVSSARP